MTLELVPFRGHTVPVLNGEISRYNVAELIAQIQYSQGYLGAPMPVTTYGNRPAEPITNSFQGFVEGMLYPDGPVAAAEAYRLRVFGQAPILYQEMVDGRPGDLFDDEALDRLRAPWTGAYLGDLMKRILIYGDFGGNGFILDLEDELVLVRPDWVEFVLAKRMHRGGQVGWKQVGIVYYEGGLGIGDGVPFLPGEYSHFLPGLPDPLANYRGMSWLTPLVREVQADKRAHEHKLAYFENAASPNLAVSLPKEITPSQFEAFVTAMDDKHKGARNAYSTLYTAGGADVTVIGANMQQMDFSAVIGKGETRIANASGVPPTLLSFSEGMQGSSLNAGNYTAAKRNFVDTTMRDLWANFAGSLQQMDTFRPPREKTRLWYDGRDIPFLHEDSKDLAEIQQTRAATINSYITTGFTPESATMAVLADDVKLLEHTGLTSVQLLPPGSQDADGDGVPDAEAQAGEDYEAALDEFRSELEPLWEEIWRAERAANLAAHASLVAGDAPTLDEDEEFVERADYYNIRVDKGLEGGGRFRKLSDIIGQALNNWLNGDGDADDPLEPFTREQLRKASKDLGVEPRRGASAEEIKLGLLKDARARFRGERDADADAPSGPVRMTLASPAFRDLDVGVYHEANGKVGIYRLSPTSQRRGSKVVSVDSLAALQQWGEDNGEPQVSSWAASERGGGAEAEPEAPTPTAEMATPETPDLDRQIAEAEARVRVTTERLTKAQAAFDAASRDPKTDALGEFFPLGTGGSGGGRRGSTDAQLRRYVEARKARDAAQSQHVRAEARLKELTARQGAAGKYSRDTVSAGDVIKVKGSWYRVQKANDKTVQVDAGPGMDLKYRWEQVTDHRAVPATDEAPAAPTPAKKVAKKAVPAKVAPKSAGGVASVPVTVHLRTGASMESTSWSAERIEGLSGSDRDALAAMTSYVRRPGFVNTRLRTPAPDPDPTAWKTWLHEGSIDEMLGRVPFDETAEQTARERADKMIAALDRVMDQSRTTSPMTTYRGASVADIGLPEPGHAVGHTWTDAGYVSTSSTRSVASGSFGSGSGRVTLDIRVPEGTPALRVDGLGEAEVLLGHGMTFRVVEDRRTPKGSGRVVVEVVPTDAPAPTPAKKAAKKAVPAKRQPKGAQAKGADLLAAGPTPLAEALIADADTREGGGDALMAALAERQGFDGRPTVVSADELQRLIVQGHEPLYRGIYKTDDASAEDFGDQLRTGPAYFPSGNWGAGIYASEQLHTARRYGPDPLRMALRPDARVAEWKDLSPEHMAFLAGLDPDDPAREVFADQGRYAAARGYDALRITGSLEDEVLVFNRSALVVQGPKPPAKPPAKPAAKSPAPSSDVDTDLSSLRAMPTEARRDALDERKLPELKAMLKAEGLPVSGRKRELVDRLVERLDGDGPKADAPDATPNPDAPDVEPPAETAAKADGPPVSRNYRNDPFSDGWAPRTRPLADEPIYPPNGGQDQGLVHMDSAMGNLWMDLYGDDRVSNSYLNRVAQLGESLSPRRGGASIDDQVIPQLRALEAEAPDQGVASRIRSTIDDLSAAPVTPDIPDGVPEPLARALRALAGIPTARKKGRIGASNIRPDELTVLDRKLEAVRDMIDGKYLRGGEFESKLKARDLHESGDGATQMWALFDTLFTPRLVTGYRTNPATGRSEPVEEPNPDYPAMRDWVKEMVRLARERSSPDTSRSTIPDADDEDEVSRAEDEPEADEDFDDDDDLDPEIDYHVSCVDWGDDDEAERSQVDEDDELIRAMDRNQLKHYWTVGKGLRKWLGHPHPWTALYKHLRKYVGAERAKRMAAQWVHDVTGNWPGSDAHRVATGHKPRGNRIGPG